MWAGRNVGATWSFVGWDRRGQGHRSLTSRRRRKPHRGQFQRPLNWGLGRSYRCPQPTLPAHPGDRLHTQASVAFCISACVRSLAQREKLGRLEAVPGGPPPHHEWARGRRPWRHTLRGRILGWVLKSFEVAQRTKPQVCTRQSTHNSSYWLPTLPPLTPLLPPGVIWGRVPEGLPAHEPLSWVQLLGKSTCVSLLRRPQPNTRRGSLNNSNRFLTVLETKSSKS